MTQMARVGGLLALTALAGCDCGTPPNDCMDLSIDTTPAVDATDVNQTVDVVATLKRGMSTPVNIGTGRLSVKGPSDADFGASADGVVMDSTVTFAGRMLTAGANTLKVVLSEKDSTCTVTKDIRVTVRQTPMVPPALMAVEFPQDANGNGTLNAQELPMGAALQVRVRAVAGTGAGARVTLRDPAGAVLGAETDLIMDVANVMVAAPGANVAFVTVQATAARGTQTSAPISATIQIRRAPPACMNTSPDLVGPNNDADANTAGFQLALMGTVGATATAARFEATPGNLASAGTVSAGMAAGVVTIPTMGDVTYSTTLIATDTNGNECRSTKNVRANFQGPRLTVASPVNPDGGAVDITQTPQAITVTSMGLENGRQICVTAQVGTGMPTQVGCGAVTNGSATFDLNLMADGPTAFVVSATDSVGNRGETTFNGNVVLEGCVPAFDTALNCPTTYLTSSSVTGGMFTFSGSARTRCMGQPARLYLGATTTPAATTTVGATGAIAFPATTVVSGTYDVRIEVDRVGVGAPYTVTCADVVVDLVRPAISNPMAAVPPAIINASQDLQPTIAGAQRQLAFSGTIPANGAAVACMNQMLGSSGTACPRNTGFFLMNPAAGVGTSPVAGFTFPEGEYQVLVAFTRGLGVNSSAPVAVRVDVTAPCVAMNGFTLPQDTAPTGGDGRLNVAELNGLNPQVAVQLDPACGDSSPSAPAPTVSIRELTGTTPGATRATGAGSTTAPVTMTFTAAVTAVTNLNLFAEAVDWVGNRNTAAGASNRAVRTLGVYPELPACAVTAPTANARLNASAVSSGIFTQAQTAGGGVVGSNGVQFSLTRGAGAPTAQTSTPSGTGLASSTFTTMDGAYSLAARCTDVAGNERTSAAVAFSVDSTPPGSCTVTTPVSNTSTLTNVVATTVTTSTTEANATVRVVSNLPAANTEVGTFALNGTTATSTLTYTLGAQDLAVTITDDYGNACTAAVTNLNVTSTTCVFTVTKGVTNGGVTWLNKTAQGDTTVQVTSSNCFGQNATLTRTSPAGTFNATTSVTTGVASFAVTPVDGDEYTIVVGTSAPTTVRVDFVDPGVPVGAFTVAGAAPTVGDLKFVAAAGNPRVSGGPLATAGYYADSNPGTAGAQIALAINGITAGRHGAANGRAEVVFGGSVIASEAVDADPDSVTFAGQITFPHPSLVQSLAIRVTDQAGNTVTAFGGNAVVDVVGPADPAAQLGAPSRGGTVGVTWTQVYDDGTDSASGSVTYDLRWTTAAVNGNNSMALESNYFAATSFREAPITAATSRSLALPPLTQYFVALRAYDEVDNYSPFTPPSGLSNTWSITEVTDLSTTSQFGQSVAVADLNGDGTRDLLVSAPGPLASSLGAVMVHWGGPSLASSAITGCDAGCQLLGPPDGVGGRLGLDIGSGDIDGAGTDIVISQTSYSAGQGRVFVFFGSTDGGSVGTSPAEVLEIRGNAANTALGQTARIVPDVNGDGLDELVVFSPGYEANNANTTLRGFGRGYMWFGRTRANWQSLGGPIPLSSADREFDGPVGKIYTTTTNNGFGMNRFGFTTLGRPSASPGGNDFMIPMSRRGANQAFLWSASTVTSGMKSQASTSALQRLFEPADTASTSTLGYACAAVGGTELVVTSSPMLTDLAIAFPIQNQVRIHTDLTRSGVSGTPLTFTGPNVFGATLASGAFADGTGADLVVGEGGISPTAVWVLPQRPDGGFDNAPQNSGDIAFFAVPLRPSVSTPGSSTFGASSAVGDVTGDGSEDIVVADPGLATVRIYR